VAQIPGIALVENPGYFFFHAWFPTAVRHAVVPPTAAEETALATIEADRAAALREGSSPRRPDVGYRAFARAYVGEHGPECRHTAFGPRCLEGIGWDPRHQLNCAGCTRRRIPEIQKYDAENRCDKVRPDVVLSWACEGNHLVPLGSAPAAVVRFLSRCPLRRPQSIEHTTGMTKALIPSAIR